MTSVVPAPGRTQSHILCLPPEIIEAISDFTWQSPWPALTDEEDPTQPDQEAQYGLSGKLALRLTCRELMSKTFQSFGKTFFADLTTVTTEPALERLLGIKNHKGLSSFPRTLCIGPHRLLSPSEIAKRVSYLKRGVFTDEAVLGLLALTQSGEGISDRTAYDQAALEAAATYLEALHRQRMVEFRGTDVTMLAEAMAGFPRLTVLQVGQVQEEYSYWGSKDLFRDSGYVRVSTLLATGYSKDALSHMTRTTAKVISALIAVKQSQSCCWIDCGLESTYRKPVNITRLLIDHYVDPEEYQKEFPVQLQLHRLAAPLESESWSELMVDLTSVVLNLHGYIRPFSSDRQSHVNARGCIDRLLASHQLESLSIEFENVAAFAHELSTPGVMMSLADREPFIALRTITLTVCADYIVPDVARFLGKNSATIESLELKWATERFQDWQCLWKAIRQCGKLQYLSLAARKAGGGYRDMAWYTTGDVRIAMDHLLNGCSILDLEDVLSAEKTAAETALLQAQSRLADMPSLSEWDQTSECDEAEGDEIKTSTNDVDTAIKHQKPTFSDVTSVTRPSNNSSNSPFLKLQPSTQGFGSGKALTSIKGDSFGVATIGHTDAERDDLGSCS